jgi:putative membrane protein
MNILVWEQQKKVRWAIAISLIFHLVGLVGIVWIDQPGFAAMTPMNLLLSLGLIIWCQQKIDFTFLIFFLVAFQTGFFTEYLGVNHQLLFGHYRYEEVLGIKYFGVPLMIGVNWFMIVYCSAVTSSFILNIFSRYAQTTLSVEKSFIGELIFIIVGALITMGFDWIMEPAAIKLGYWTWLTDTGIPIKNYRDWFLVSAFLLWVFRRLHIRVQNQFPVYLLWIQTLFFVLLRFIL